MPLLVAYILQGAKVPVTFAPLFCLTAALFCGALLSDIPITLPKRVLFPFTAYFVWLWLALLKNPPLELFLFSLAKVALYGIFAAFVAHHKKDHLALAILVVGLAVSESVLVRWNYAELAPLYMEQFGGWLKNPLHSGILVPVGMLFSILCLQLKGDRRRALFCVIAIVLFGYTIFLLRSRAGMLSMAILVPFLVPSKWRGKVFISAGVVLVAIGIAGREHLLKYLEIDAYGILSTLGRLTIWKTDLLAIIDSPLIGVGAGNFEAAFLKFHQPSGEILRYAKSTIFAHNGLLQTAVESGVPACIFLIWGVSAVVLGSKAFKTKDLAARWALFTLFSFFIVGLFNYALFLPFNGLVFSAALGILISEMDEDDDQRISLVQFKTSLLFFSGFFSLFSVCYGIADYYADKGDVRRAIKFMPVSGSYWYQYAMEGLNDQNFRTSKAGQAEILARLKKSLLMNPGDPFVWSRAAGVTAALSVNSGQAETQAAYQRAVKLAPTHTPFWVEWGFYDLSKNNLAGALESFEMARFLEPRAPLPYMGEGLVHFQAGNFKDARTFFLQAKELKQKQPELEAMSGYNKELINTPYGKFLFNVDIGQIDGLLLKASKKTK